MYSLKKKYHLKKKLKKYIKSCIQILNLIYAVNEFRAEKLDRMYTYTLV